MLKLNVRTKDEILREGIEFTGDVCFSGEYGDEVYDKEMEDGGKPITGMIYEKDDIGNILYYAFYVDGVANGDYVSFYESGAIKEMYVMRQGTKWGESVVLYENGAVKCIEKCKYGIVLNYKKFDVDGRLVKEKKEPSEQEKRLLCTFQRAYGEI